MDNKTQSNVHKFEIELYEEVTNEETGDVIGKRLIPSQKPIYITATSKADLDNQMAFYKTLGQIAKIVREVPMPVQQPSQNIVKEQKTSETTTPENIPEQQVNTVVAPVQVQSCQSAQVKAPPKYYSVSGIDIKDDNGKIYQKQWVKLSEKETENIRLVNTTTNKIISTSGKHFEVKKWVLVETTTEDSTLNLED